MAEDQARELKDLVSAAQQGDARAQFELGRRHYHGVGAPKDLAAAARWFRRAASQQHLVARIYLAEITGEEDRISRTADGGFDRWLLGAMEALRRGEVKRREPQELKSLLRARSRRAWTMPLALMLAVAILSAVLWWWRSGI